MYGGGAAGGTNVGGGLVGAAGGIGFVTGDNTGAGVGGITVGGNKSAGGGAPDGAGGETGGANLNGGGGGGKKSCLGGNTAVLVIGIIGIDIEKKVSADGNS